MSPTRVERVEPDAQADGEQRQHQRFAGDRPGLGEWPQRAFEFQGGRHRRSILTRGNSRPEQAAHQLLGDGGKGFAAPAAFSADAVPQGFAARHVDDRKGDADRRFAIDADFVAPSAPSPPPVHSARPVPEPRPAPRPAACGRLVRTTRPAAGRRVRAAAWRCLGCAAVLRRSPGAAAGERRLGVIGKGRRPTGHWRRASAPRCDRASSKRRAALEQTAALRVNSFRMGVLPVKFNSDNDRSGEFPALGRRCRRRLCQVSSRSSVIGAKTDPAIPTPRS